MTTRADSSRLFIALAVPGEIKEQLQRAQSDLRSHLFGSAVSWTRPNNLHVTLRFLGNVSNDRCDALKRALAASVDSQPTLNLIAERLDCFPNLRHPRVVWAGVHDAGQQIQELHRRISVATGPFSSEPAEKVFVGHVTLARIKRIRREETERLAAYLHRSLTRRFGTWRAETILLMRSELAPGGSRHTRLAEFALSGCAASETAASLPGRVDRLL